MLKPLRIDFLKNYFTSSIRITNEFYAGMNDIDSDATGIAVSSNSWELNFDGNTEQRTMEVC